MKFSTTVETQPAEMSVQQRIKISSGLIGFPKFVEAALVYKPDQLPFMWLQGTGKDVSADAMSFLVTEPAGIVPDYEIDIADADVEALGLKTAADALVLNIATLQKKNGQPQSISLNLIGPVLVNRRTLQARQVIISNAHKYSAQHVLFENKETTHPHAKEG